MDGRLVAAALESFKPSLARVMAFAAALIAAVISAAFAAYAAYAALSISIDRGWAAAIVAGGALLLAAILAAIARRRPAPARPAQTRAPRRDLAPEALAELIRAIHAAPKEAAGLALVAGFLAGTYPELLDAARGLIDPE